jgi:demethylmenaquinone methyltransferase/2-methoxy-6-polyprenyl-1,4-benzoquinol methylase
MAKKRKYSLQTVNEVYSYWGKSPLVYRMSASFFIFDPYIRNKVIEAAGLKKGSIVMDLACGPGIMLKRLEKKVGQEGRIIAVDYVEEMIKQSKKIVKRKKWENVELLRQDAAKLKFKPNSVDAIISVIGMSAIPDHKRALKNCYRCLKAGGKLVVLDGKDFNSKYRLLNPILKMLRWSKSYEKKDLVGEMKKVFGNVKAQEYLLGSTFVAVCVKR